MQQPPKAPISVDVVMLIVTCCLQAQVTADNAAAAKGNGAGAFTVRLEGPANLWGKLKHHFFQLTAY